MFFHPSRALKVEQYKDFSMRKISRGSFDQDVLASPIALNSKSNQRVEEIPFLDRFTFSRTKTDVDELVKY